MPHGYCERSPCSGGLLRSTGNSQQTGHKRRNPPKRVSELVRLFTGLGIRAPYAFGWLMVPSCEVPSPFGLTPFGDLYLMPRFTITTADQPLQGR